MKKLSWTRRKETTFGPKGWSQSRVRWVVGSHIPMGVWLVVCVLALFLVAGCGGDTDVESIDTGSLTSEDLPGLLPDADTVSSALGVTIDPVDASFGLSDWLSQGFEHADSEVIEDLRRASAYASSYRAASESDSVGTPLRIQLTLFETSDAAQAAMEVLIGELEVSTPLEFDVADLSDAGRGLVFDFHPPSSTWTLLRWDSLLAVMVASHPLGSEPTESARSLAEEIKANLSTIANG